MMLWFKTLNRKFNQIEALLLCQEESFLLYLPSLPDSLDPLATISPIMIEW